NQFRAKAQRPASVLRAKGPADYPAQPAGLGTQHMQPSVGLKAPQIRLLKKYRRRSVEPH
ncbi:MAG: hypothetical protein ABI557_18555, partial [Aureliella sp.]